MKRVAFALAAALVLGVQGLALAQRPAPKVIDVFRMVGEIRAAEGRPVVALLYGSECSLSKAMFPGFVGLAREFEPRGVTFLVFNTDGAQYGEYAGEFLLRHGAKFENLVVRDWAPGELSGAMKPLGVNVGKSWTRPLAAVFDRNGNVVFQSQGQTRLEGLRAAIERAAR